MNKRGFTLIELLATLIVLGIIMTFTIVGVNASLDKAKKKSEEAFINTIRDALNVYLDSNAKSLDFGTDSVCTIHKTHGDTLLFQATDESLTFDNVINSTYSPILKSELVNPANKDKDRYNCDSNGKLEIFRDEDYVYYYKIAGSSFNCFNDFTENITNLPTECR